MPHLDTPEPAIVALWSAPRSRSTAFLRMMVERGDRLVVHEPFSLLADFGETSVCGRTVTSEDELIDLLLETAAVTPLFFKDTTDFPYPRLLERDDFMTAVCHGVILRHPAPVIASHHHLNRELTRDEIGFGRLADIHDRALELGRPPVVIDSDDLVADPAATVAAYCAAVGIAYLPEALHWSPGMREDWQTTDRWHRSTSSTTGFEGRRDVPGDVRFDDHRLRAFVDYHLPFYERLRARRLVPSTVAA